MTYTEKIFGTNLCCDKVLKKYMTPSKYLKYKKLKNNGLPLNTECAKAVARAMKKWAIEKGATHYSHWFLPLTGKNAEKQTSFLEIDKKGRIKEDFNEKMLIKGETDASSFPNGGERMTFEARGYTVWDYTSPAFIKEDNFHNKVLYIPTAFCSYNGTALDEKTPLLRAIEALNRESLRMLKHLGYNNVKKVICNVGGEQEYFLIKKKDYSNRLDLKVTSSTLLGAAPIRSQEYYSHYFGVINGEILEIMNKVNDELWRMGIVAKLQHNEVAPSQFELVPMYAPANISSDQNQLIMDTLSKVADTYGYAALFHEKPFSYINGSGKHINWSISTDTGLNLLDSNIEDKTLFLTFFVSMLSAIDTYSKLIRTSAANRGNDLRLGGHEAPPRIISVFVGADIEDMLYNLENSVEREKPILNTGVMSMFKTTKDYCDRNRTSPFAYTGNKFEFRMVGSSQALAWPCTCICTIVAKTLKSWADKLDKSTSDNEIKMLLSDEINKHKRIIFNGNGYDKEWEIEAKKRNLKDYKDSMECFETLTDDDIIELFETTKVLNKNELTLRKNTYIKSFVETIAVEAKTLKDMIFKSVVPCVNSYINELTSHHNNNFLTSMAIVEKLTRSMDIMSTLANNLDLNNNIDVKNTKEIVNTISQIRSAFDDIEYLLPEHLKPFPNYNDILF